MRSLPRRAALSLAMLISLASATLLHGDKDGLRLAGFTWNGSPELWEPPSTSVTILNQTIARKEHQWVGYSPSVTFECQLRGAEVWAVNPLPSEPRPSVMPYSWDKATLVNFLGGVLGTFQLTEAGVITDIVATPTYTKPGCFGINWSAKVVKTGSTFSYTPPVPAGPNVLVPQPRVYKLDGDMDDKLKGMVEICCCTWDKKQAVFNPGAGEKQDGAAGETVQDSINPELAETNDGAEHVLSQYGVDWTAVDLQPVSSWGDPATSWKGTYELKACTYSTIGVITASGAKEERRKKSKDYDPADEAKDADAAAISNP